jgi:mRNA interferase YafQ
MYAVSCTGKFKRDLKRYNSLGLDIELLREVVDILVRTGSLPRRYRPYKIHGKYAGKMECHTQPDWLLAWQLSGNEIILLDTGAHADLF